MIKRRRGRADPRRAGPSLRLLPLLAVLLFAVGGCPDDSGPPWLPEPTAARWHAGTDQPALSGVPLADSLVVAVEGAEGEPLSVLWEVVEGEADFHPGSGGFLSPEGRASVLVVPRGSGRLTVQARVTGVSATTRWEVEAVGPTTRWTGRDGWIEYRAGTLPLVLTAPHGGTLEPAQIPYRTTGVTVRDLRTDILARALADAIERRTGERPHLIVSNLHRSKLDPNREVVEATNGNPLSEHAWREYHALIEVARARIEAEGPGLLLDLHGHGHEVQRLELGYLVPGEVLDRPDAELDGWAGDLSVAARAARTGASISEVLRGPGSLGARFEAAGYPAVPSPADPGPGAAPFFSGGYTTARWGSAEGGRVDAVQLEANRVGVRDSEAAVEAFAEAVAAVVVGWIGG